MLSYTSAKEKLAKTLQWVASNGYIALQQDLNDPNCGPEYIKYIQKNLAQVSKSAREEVRNLLGIYEDE